MFVQLNPDPDSYSETVSTLKFAERVSGVELGAAKSNREGRDIRELVDQVLSPVQKNIAMLLKKLIGPSYVYKSLTFYKINFCRSHH